MSAASTLLSLASCEAILGVEPTEVGEPSAGSAGTRDAAAGDGGGGSAAGPAAAGEDSEGNGDAGSGAGAGGASDDPPTIAGSSLPTALLNVAYAFQFETAAAGGGVSFRVASGALPEGVLLDPSGALRGRPQEAGVFEFEIEVEDDRTHLTHAAPFALRVEKRRWLAYISNEPNGVGQQVYALNLETGSKGQLSANIPVEGGVTQFAWSPDGKHLAFPARSTEGSVDLYVVDFRTDFPSLPAKVNDRGDVFGFAWSPDSRSLAFASSAAQREPSGVYYVDMSDDFGPRLAASTAYTPLGIGWVTSNLLVYNDGGEAKFIRRSSDGFEAAEGILRVTTGTFQRAWGEREIAAFEDPPDLCFTDVQLVQLEPASLGRMREFTGVLNVSQDFGYIAHRGIDQAFRIYRAWDTKPLVTFPTSLPFPTSQICSRGAWSQGSSLFAAPGHDGRVQVFSTVNGALRTVDGDYGEAGERESPAFSPDDGWLAFPTSKGAFAAKRVDGVFPEAAPAGANHRSYLLGSEPLIRFSPDSAVLFVAEHRSFDDVPRVVLTDLRDGTPLTFEIPIPDLEPGASIFNALWSIHSTELVLILTTAGTPSPMTLYLVSNPRDPARATARKLVGTVPCTDANFCESVSRVALQP